MQKSCRQCAQKFEITDEDLEFYDKVSPVFADKKFPVPPPTLCPSCREQRRLAFRNERNLYHRKCNLCGKSVISIYSDDKPHTIYCQNCFWSDKWNALNHGMEFDFNRPFFDQYRELLERTPIPAINMHGDNENCDFTNLSSNNKDCYMVFASSDNENSYYCTYLQRSKTISDCFFIFDSELCYECIDCYNGYRLAFSQFTRNCSDSMFLYDCKNCTNCIGCAGLVNKKYHIFNKQCSNEEYENKRKEIISDPNIFNKTLKEFENIKIHIPHKYYSGINNENVSGDHISFSKNAHNCYDCTYLEDSKYCTWFHRAKDCYDCYAWGYPAELGYEVQLCGNNFYKVLFSAWSTDNLSELIYCYYCANNAKNLFGCVSLHQKNYCIFNKQYNKKEYEILAGKIIDHMHKTNEWGEFFPMEIAPFCYNETVAMEYFPLTKDKVEKLNLNWKKETPISKYQGKENKIPFNIKETDYNIVKQIFECENCGKNYKIITQEYDLCRTLQIPLPKNCFNCRYGLRRGLRNPRNLWHRKCKKCGKEIYTSYSPDRPEKIYCEDCYLKEIY